MTVEGHDEYLFSGAVGDAFIALCKLASRPEGMPVGLRRMCRHDGPDGIIARVVELFGDIDYNRNFIQFRTIEEMREYAFLHAGRYLNIYADGDGRGLEPDDPPGFPICSRPKLVLPEQTLLRVTGPIVGIHLRSGTAASGARTLSLRSIADLCALLTETALSVVLLGTGDGYADDELAPLADLPPNVVNLIGRDTFREWVAILAGLDLLIAPEGLATFFALSQGVPTVVLFRLPDAILRMPADWRRNAVCLTPVTGERGDGWKLPSPAGLAAALTARFDPDRLTLA